MTNTAITQAISQGIIASDQCQLCGNPFETLRDITNEAHWTGEKYIRVDHCSSCKVASHPRRPRQKRQPRQILATDWNMLVAFSKKSASEMNLADLVFETWKDNHIDRICDGCLHPEMSHVQNRDGAPCGERDCECDNYWREENL